MVSLIKSISKFFSNINISKKSNQDEDTMPQQSLESNRTRSNSTLRTLDSSSSAGKSLNSSPSPSSLSSSGTAGEAFLLPAVEVSSFQVPKYLPTPEWIRSQVFEVIHLLDGFFQLLRNKNPQMVEAASLKLDQMLESLERITDFSQCLTELLSLSFGLLEQERALFLQLKFETHFHTLLAHQISLVKQLPINVAKNIHEQFNHHPEYLKLQ